MDQAVVSPKVGHVVHYRPVGHRIAQAALVCHVWNERLVNLAVFDNNGVPSSQTSVTFVHPGEDVNQPQFFDQPYAEYIEGKDTGSNAHELGSDTDKTSVSDAAKEEADPGDKDPKKE